MSRPRRGSKDCALEYVLLQHSMLSLWYGMCMNDDLQRLYKALHTLASVLSAIRTTLRQRGKEPKRFYPQESSTSNQRRHGRLTDSTGDRQAIASLVFLCPLFLFHSFILSHSLSIYSLSLSLLHPIPFPSPSTAFALRFTHPPCLPPLALDISRL